MTDDQVIQKLLSFFDDLNNQISATKREIADIELRLQKPLPPLQNSTLQSEVTMVYGLYRSAMLYSKMNKSEQVQHSQKNIKKIMSLLSSSMEEIQTCFKKLPFFFISRSYLLAFDRNLDEAKITLKSRLVALLPEADLSTI